jgi:outer membrane protein assembly factor BamB
MKFFAILTVLAGVAFAADQPQWGERYTRNMVSSERNLPDSFDPATARNLKWQATLGTETYSTPIVARGKVFIGTNNGQPRDPRHKGDRSILMCFNEQDGRFLWQLVVPKVTNSVYWDWPKAGLCSSPTVESERLYLVSNRGEVLCLDINGMANGNDGPFQDEAAHGVPAGDAPVEPAATDADIIWRFDILKTCGVRQHDQAHCSILLHGQFLYVNTSNGVDDTHRHIDAPEAPSLIVLDKTTGRLVAQDDEHIGPHIIHSTWSSPALGEIDGRPLLFFCGGNAFVYAFEPVQTPPPPSQVLKLKKVWQFDCDPAAPKENIHKYMTNRKISPSNIKSMPVFCRERLFVTVGGDVWWGKNEAWLKCLDPRGAGDLTQTAELWSYPLDKHCMSTPAVHQGLVFAADCGGKLHCVEAQTGRPCWTHETKGEMWSSPLVADGKVYVGTRTGEFWVLAADKGKQVLGNVRLDSPVHDSPVAANGVLYVATMKHLYAFANK